MENKKIDLLFGVVVIAFLVVTLYLIKDFKAKRANDYKKYSATIANIVKMKNDIIIKLSKENADLENTLTETRNELDALSKKLAQPIPTAAPVSAPATVPAPVAAASVK